MNTPNVLWAVRRLTLWRGLKRQWAVWRASGGLVVLAYAVPIFGVLAVGGLDLLRRSHLDLPAWTLSLLALALNAWALWQPWKLVFPVPLGAALPLVLPGTLSLEPQGTGALLCLSGLLAFCLGLAGPGVPAFLPLSSAAARLARTLPPALVLGMLAGCAALISALLTHSSAVLVLPVLLLPWAALSLGVWADSGGWLPKAQAAQMRLGLAFLPVLALCLTVRSPLPWLAPPALLLLGIKPHIPWLMEVYSSLRRQRKTGLAPARQP